MATAPTYCTHRQLKDVFPQVDSFDNKRPIYGWESLGNNVYISYNCGIVTQLFMDGKGMGAEFKIDGNSTIGSFLEEAIQADNDIDLPYDTFGITDSTVFKVGDVCKIDSLGDSDDEFCLLTAINTTPSPDELTVIRYSDTKYTHASGSGGSGTKLLVQGRMAEANNWYYISDLDAIICYSATDPNDLSMEAGEDFSTLITRITGNASRYLDAKLDPNLPKEQLKDKEGNFDYIIVRTTALIAATFLIRSHDPTSEIATALMEDAMGNIDALNKGGAALSWQTTGDSSKGVVRDVTYTSGSIRPVDLRGRASGVDYDLIKVSISASTAGVIGTAKYNVYVKDATGLKTNQVVTEEIITGDYQPLAHGLQIRFGGSTDASVATANNEWEIEVAGWQEEVDNSAVNSVRMTRR